MITYHTIQEFLIYNCYVFELTFSIILYCHFFERKRYSFFHFLLWFSFLLVFFLLWNREQSFFSQSVWILCAYNVFKYLVAFLLGYLGIYFCVRTTWSEALFCIICAIATQHLSYRIYSSILAVLQIDFISIHAFFITLAVSVLVYLSLYFILVRRIKNHPERCFENKINILLGGLLILFTILLHFWSETLVSIWENPALFVLISIYDMVCCICTLALEYGLFQVKKLVNDKEIWEHLIHNQENQYEISKTNIEMINIKCHDMKHQIIQLTSHIAPDSIKEMENIINIYDSSLKTGNEILDIFLMEKKLLCEKNDIKLDCIVNGSGLSFMQPSDIYSLFGNALDNAIEALCKIDNPERRIIGLQVKTQMDMVVIHIENFCDQNLQFHNGIPLTTKPDSSYHGYGIKSIQMVADKYNGHVSILVQDGIFNLNIIIPIQSAE